MIVCLPVSWPRRKNDAPDSAQGQIFSGEAAGTGAPVPAVPDAPDMPLSRQTGKNLFEGIQMSYKCSF